MAPAWQWLQAFWCCYPGDTPGATLQHLPALMNSQRQSESQHLCPAHRGWVCLSSTHWIIVPKLKLPLCLLYGGMLWSATLLEFPCAPQGRGIKGSAVRYKPCWLPCETLPHFCSSHRVSLSLPYTVTVLIRHCFFSLTLAWYRQVQCSYCCLQCGQLLFISASLWLFPVTTRCSKPCSWWLLAKGN